MQAGSKYTDVDRRRAVVEWCLHGNQLAIERITGIPNTTISHWRLHSDWWDEELAKVREEIGEQILAQNLEIATKAAKRVLDSLENGDEKLVWDKNKNEHVIKRVKPSGKDAAVISGISQDKARIQMGMPTAITGKSSDMTALGRQFQELSKQWNEKQVDVVAIKKKCEDAE